MELFGSSNQFQKIGGKVPKNGWNSSTDLVELGGTSWNYRQYKLRRRISHTSAFLIRWPLLWPKNLQTFARGHLNTKNIGNGMSHNWIAEMQLHFAWDFRKTKWDFRKIFLMQNFSQISNDNFKTNSFGKYYCNFITLWMSLQNCLNAWLVTSATTKVLDVNPGGILCGHLNTKKTVTLKSSNIYTWPPYYTGHLINISLVVYI